MSHIGIRHGMYGSFGSCTLNCIGGNQRDDTVHVCVKLYVSCARYLTGTLGWVRGWFKILKIPQTQRNITNVVQ